MPASTTVWLITGASSGLGLEMALAALRAGHRVIGTGRNVSEAAINHPAFSQLGGQWLQLDLGHVEAQTILETAVSEEETLANGSPIHWVVVNNAGSTILGVIEDMSEGQISSYVQANVFGAIRVYKAMAPALRRQRQGTLIMISSIFGFLPKSEHMMYSAVKAMTSSLTESYANLLAPFGVRTLLIEPGGFRTSFARNNTKADGGVSKDYEDKIRSWMDFVDVAGINDSVIKGDPVLFGQRILEAVEGLGAFKSIWASHDMETALRVPLGSDCYALYGERLKQISDGYHKMADIASSTDSLE